MAHASQNGTFASFCLAACFFIFLCSAVFFGKLSWVLLALYAIASTVTFLAYAFDKAAAKNQQWRMRENTLHFCSLIGGWPGALVAQKLVRHKSSKLSFQVAFWSTVVLNLGIVGWLLFWNDSNVLCFRLLNCSVGA